MMISAGWCYSVGSAKVKDGTLRALAVTSSERLPGLPETPTVAESGLKDFSYYVYNGLLAPAGTPKEVISRLAEALQAVLADQDVQRRFREGGGEALRLSPEAFDALLRQDVQNMSKLAQELGLEKN
jgi:tripartite-type tricarboxylate transporter receptor subunit TctC